ncbi:glutaredoxin family protein [Legionella fairfieldensis]|uniref:glutaredoxin family protein n=1 Tax=Legionella fairfieldensis TaxID=45064 RepID=UPI000683DE06|nr:glutaredoxin domain-containing protein [Legionella fairfieldensis]
MRNALKSISGLFLFVFVSVSWASLEPAGWFTRGEGGQIKLRVDLFISSTCPHCQKADAFLQELALKETWLEIHHYIINEDKEALEKFHQALQKEGSSNYSVPALFFCNSHWIGFDEATTTGKVLADNLNYCYQQINKTGKLNADTIGALKQAANASWLGSDMTNKLSAVSFIPAIALIDALNPCALFCLFALFAFVWLYKKLTIQVGLGILFLIGVAIAHHLQQGHEVLFYQIKPGLRLLTVLVGMGLFAYIVKFSFQGLQEEHQTLAIPVVVVLTGLLLQAYQQVCVPNFVVVFRQWLDINQFSFVKRGIYEISYQLIYSLPSILLMLFIIFLRKSKRWEKLQTLLTCTAWCILLIIGVFFVFYPQGFSSLILSLVTLILSLLTGWLITRQKYWLVKR